MINNAPNNPRKGNGKSKYKQGNFIPENKDKVLKLNSQGGIYYRSGYELKIYKYLDVCERVKHWGAEFIEIPYSKRSVKKTDWGEYIYETTNHRYYPDVYYELESADGTIKKIIGEIKPYSETLMPTIPKRATKKQLENFEYAMKMWNSNMYKWERAIEYANNREMEFVIITEKYLKLLRN